MLRHGTLALLTLATPLCARAEVFLSEQQAIRTIFPVGTFAKKSVTLATEEVDKIDKDSKEPVQNRELNLWKSELGDAVYIDQVLGKHETITYAIGIQKDGTVKDIEVMEYKETYGGQVRTEAWRKQFVGKSVASPVKLGDDIKNLSGASLSSAHITAGVKRILLTNDAIKARI